MNKIIALILFICLAMLHINVVSAQAPVNSGTSQLYNASQGTGKNLAPPAVTTINKTEVLVVLVLLMLLLGTLVLSNESARQTPHKLQGTKGGRAKRKRNSKRI